MIKYSNWFQYFQGICLELILHFSRFVSFLLFSVFWSFCATPFLHFPTKRCLFPFLLLPFLTQNSKVDWVNDPIDLILNQLHSSLRAARTVSTGCGRHLSPLSLPSSGLNFLFLTFNSECPYLFFSSVFFPPLNLESLPPVIVNKLVFFPPTKS